MKKITSMLCLCILMLLFQGCFMNVYDVEPVSKEDIESITITDLSQDQSWMGDETQIESFVDAFNHARSYTNDAGTTHLMCADVLFTDETHLFVWGDWEATNQGFLTMVKIDAQGNRGEQQNIHGVKLDQWFSNLK